MKPVLTFVLGAVLASGVAYLAMRKPPQPPEMPFTLTNPSVAAPAGIPPAGEPVREPEPVRQPEPVRTSAPKHKSQVAAPRKSAASEPVAQSMPKANTPVNPPAVPPQEPAPVIAQSTPPPVSAPQPAIEAPQPRVPLTVTVPAGSLITVRLDEALSSDRNRAGDTFRAILDQPLVVDGVVLAERGARVLGRVTETEEAGRVRGVARLSLELIQLNTSDGQKAKIQTETFSKQGDTSKRGDAEKIGAGAAIGAAIGAIAGGGKGAAIGAGAGGAAGTGGVLMTRGKPAQIPIETKLSFRLRDPINLTERLRN